MATARPAPIAGQLTYGDSAYTLGSSYSFPITTATTIARADLGAWDGWSSNKAWTLYYKYTTPSSTASIHVNTNGFMRFSGGSMHDWRGTQTIDVASGQLRTYYFNGGWSEYIGSASNPMYVSYGFQSDTAYSIAIAFDGSNNVGTQPDAADFAVYIRDDTAGGAWSEALAYTADSDTWDASDAALDMSGQDLVLMSPTTSWDGPDYGTLHELGFWNSKLAQSQLPGAPPPPPPPPPPVADGPLIVGPSLPGGASVTTLDLYNGLLSLDDMHGLTHGAPLFASVHWPMRMDKSWAVQFRMKLGARVHESKTPLVSYFQTPENGAAPPGWYLLLEETASARTLSLHVFLNFAAASSAQVVAEWTIGAASAGATTTTTHAIDWVAPISGAASAGGTVTAATGDAVVLNWASGHNVYRADGACPGTLDAFQAAAGYQAIHDAHPGGGNTHDVTPADDGTYCFACISHYTTMHFTLALNGGVLGAAPSEWGTALEANEPTPFKLLYTHSGAAKLQSSDFAIELGGVRVAGAATATTDDFPTAAFDRALDLAAVGRLGLGGWDTSLQPAHAQLTTLAHNWPYAGDPLFTDIILSERGVDDAWQSTAIDVGPDAASLAMAHTGERFVVGYPTHDRVRVWALNASGWYEFFSTDHYFDAGANDPQVSPGDGYGTTVAMSGNGEVIVVGAPATKRVYTHTRPTCTPPSTPSSTRTPTADTGGKTTRRTRSPITGTSRRTSMALARRSR